MKVQVHHRDHESGKLVHVANVSYAGEDIDAGLEHAWRRSNNIDGSWSRGIEIGGQRNPDYSAEVERLVPLPVYDGREYGLRSSMVGDVFVIEGVEAFRVASCGFEVCEVPA